MPPRRDDIIGFALALVLALGTVALAHVLPAATSAAPPSTPALDNETCAEWSDGCVVCQRTNDGLACSTPGIACVPRERECLRRHGP